MKYKADEALSEIMRRSGRIARKRELFTCRLLSGLTLTLLAAIVLVIAILPGKTAVIWAGSTYGAFLLSPEAGGYVLVAVLAFVAGVVFTVLVQKYRRN